MDNTIQDVNQSTPQFMVTKNEILLQAKDIDLSFPVEGGKPDDKFTVLKDVNFEIRNIVKSDETMGQVVSLIGRSGSGKTQLLKILAGLNKPTSGEVVINANKIVEAGDMGLVPQNYFLFRWRRIRRILELAAAKNPLLTDPKIRAEAVDHFIDAFELKDHIEKYPKQLSGGQKQRVSIAQQLLNGSLFVLMDEPFSGLDTLMIDKTTALISRVSKSDEKMTIIIVSHDLSNSVAISDTVYVLSKQGRQPDEGATIVKEISLIERGLAWRPDIKQMPTFHETLGEIKSLL